MNCQLKWINEARGLAECVQCRHAFIFKGRPLVECDRVCPRTPASELTGDERNRVTTRRIVNSTPSQVQRFCGPGCQLLKILRVFHKKDCGCGARAGVMDQRGADWCEANVETILEWLKEGAEKRCIPFVEWLARRFVSRAIKKARKAEGAMESPIPPR